jgi:glycosyltransferase involved in cell wall biosynthesis
LPIYDNKSFVGLRMVQNIINLVHISVYPPEGEKYTPHLSGVANYAKNLVEALQKSSVNNIVLCQKNGVDKEYIEHGVRVIPCFKKDSRFVLDLWKKIKILTPDLIHVQQEKALYGGTLTAFLLPLFILFCRIKGFPVVTTVHASVNELEITKKLLSNNGISSISPVWIARLGLKILLTLLVFSSKGIIVHTNKQQELLQKYTTNKQKIIRISHGVDTFKKVLKTIACKKLGIKLNKKVVLFFGFINGYKGVDLLLEGMALATKKNSDIMLLCCASPSPNFKNNPEYMKNTFNRLKTKAQQLLNNNQLIWPKEIRQKDMKYYFGAADTIIFPYTHQIGASGPMALAIGYDTPFLVSSALKAEALDQRMVFEIDPTSLAEKVEFFFEKNISYKPQLSLLRKQLNWDALVKTNYLPLYAKIIKENLTKVYT